MMHCVRKYSQKSLQAQLTQCFSGLFNKRKPTKKDLDKYDVVWVGCNLGGICARHFDEVVHGKYNMMVVFDQNVNQVYPLRTLYEQQRLSKTDYLPNAKLAINMYTAHSDTIGLEKVFPETNKIQLRNGRTIEYDHLVIATGMNENLEAIKGFDDAWADADHPVFAAKDHPLWKGYLHKYPRWHYNFNSGDAYFCIPPYPFRGEVETYNFFISTDLWKWYKSHGKQHPDSTLTIMNANEKFVQYCESADGFIKELLDKQRIKVEYGWNLTEVDKKTFKATFQNVKTGETSVRDYNNLYSILPTKPHPFLLEAGLASPETNGLLDVDIQTLRHKKYKNIFGLGDVCNLPTTKTFWGGFHQVHAVRNNLERSLKGQSLNALYDGYSYQPLMISQSECTYVAHFYDGKPHWQHLLFKNGGILAKIRQSMFAKKKKKFLDFYLKKTWGPPYWKFKKSFKELPGEEKQGGALDKYFAKKKDESHAAH